MTTKPAESQSSSDRAGSAPVSEDANTTAARKELKNTSISESEKATASDATATPTPTTPDSDAASASSSSDSKADSNSLREKIGSPKKKRAHDQILDTPDKAAALLGKPDTAEPEKKRPRDNEQTAKGQPPEGKEKPLPSTSASAFAKSGFAARATSNISPFGASSSGSSIFGSGAASTSSPFQNSVSPAVTTAAPKMSFGSASGTSSPFSSLSGVASSGPAKPFSSSLGGASAFGAGSTGFGAVGGSKLSSFAKPGDSTFPTKAAKPFGAPESENEEDSSEDAEDAEENDDGEEKEKEEREKKIKLQKIEVNNGESGEATILSVRARLYHLDSDMGWKERGAGNVKINVPKDSVDYDATGNVIPGTFDASSLESGDSEKPGFKGARVIMRQDQTGRVILNTVLVPAMKFQLKEGLKSTGIMFTALENGKPVNVHLKMTAINAKTWMNEVSVVQRELAGN
ncbi:Nucleoporin NUP56 [Ceratocystis fimbriata CBS 114723]|uniref:Nucleoporin NUP56 n=1 Tax=Ceratocystis fimbriata CBS 114723 TaxID=1035309 RepID=A0A2C5X0W9_9PEZI|nr:Nucleoporin NUP56 [Ceratocystis fimbriata CBS 114723]